MTAQTKIWKDLWPSYIMPLCHTGINGVVVGENFQGPFIVVMSLIGNACAMLSSRRRVYRTRSDLPRLLVMI